MSSVFDSVRKQREHASTSAGFRQSARWVLVALFGGWFAATLATGFVQAPDRLNAATPPAPSASLSPSTESAPHASQGFSAVAQNVRRAVVHIAVVHAQPTAVPNGDARSWTEEWGRKFFGRRPLPRGSQPPDRGGMGSGVLISPDGYLVTNHHVIDGATKVTVTLIDKRRFQGRVVGADPQTDLALVKVDAEVLPYLAWGDSSRLSVGDYVLAVGNPFGLTATVTQGIVSALGRGGMGITQYEDFIQTDAAINPGNSGGALVNTRGELVGINTAILSRTGGYQGIGFAVPSRMAQTVAAGLKTHGYVERGHLGVGIQELTPELAGLFGTEDAHGALVSQVTPGSPADLAGLQRGDIVVQYEGDEIEDPRALQRHVIQTPVGDAVDIEVIRDGARMSMRAVIGTHQERAAQVAQHRLAADAGLAGLDVEELTAVQGPDGGFAGDGVVVTFVQPGSPAHEAGIARGDIIREINKKQVRSVADYRRLASDRHGERVLLFVERKGVPLFIAVDV